MREDLEPVVRCVDRVERLAVGSQRERPHLSRLEGCKRLVAGGAGHDAQRHAVLGRIDPFRWWLDERGSRDHRSSTELHAVA
jgi:hypothetical protein